MSGGTAVHTYIPAAKKIFTALELETLDFQDVFKILSLNLTLGFL